MSLSTLLRGIRRPATDASAADLLATLADTEKQLAAATDSVAALDAALGDLLLAGDAAATADHETATRDAAEQVKRAEAVIGALLPRIEAAQVREAEAALQAEVAEIEAQAAAAVEDLREYERAAREMLLAAERVNVVADRVAKLNSRLHLMGRDELLVTQPLSRVWSHNAQPALKGLSVRGPRRDNASLKAFEADIATPARSTFFPRAKPADEAKADDPRRHVVAMFEKSR